MSLFGQCLGVVCYTDCTENVTDLTDGQTFKGNCYTAGPLLKLATYGGEVYVFVSFSELISFKHL